MARRTSRYVDTEAESEEELVSTEEGFESSVLSEDLDALDTAGDTAAARPRSYREFTAAMEAKYGGESTESEGEVLEAPRQAQLLPVPTSPLLFLIRCKTGREREVATRIAQNSMKMGASAESDLGVLSVVAKESLRGYVYAEAHKKTAIEDALVGLRGVSRTRLSVVPLREMAEALSSRETSLPGSFARIRSGKYRGDLVQILESHGDAVVVKAVPRLAKDTSLPCLFDPSEFPDAVRRDGGFFYNRDFFRDGFLIKTVLRKSLDFDVEPTTSDLFSLGLGTPVSIEDMVRIKRGDLSGAVGRVTAVADGAATVEHDGRSFEVCVDDLSIFYAPGDEVSHRGTNGVVLGNDGDHVIVGINDFTEEIRVLPSVLRRPVPCPTSNSAAGPGPSGGRRGVRVRRDPLVNKAVTIRDGPHKGLRGVVKDVDGDSCRVQLNTTLEIVTVGRSAFWNEAGRAGRQGDEEGRRPGYGDTPGYKTPGYKTPGYQTPGYKTPGYKTPGYKTPSYRGGLGEDAGTDWLMPQSVYDGTLASVNGEIITIADARNGIFTDKSGRVHRKEDLSYVVPQKYDNVIILDGDHAGTEGALVGVSGDTGTVKTADGGSYAVQIREISKKASAGF